MMTSKIITTPKFRVLYFFIVYDVGRVVVVVCVLITHYPSVTPTLLLLSTIFSLIAPILAQSTCWSSRVCPLSHLPLTATFSKRLISKYSGSFSETIDLCNIAHEGVVNSAERDF